MICRSLLAATAASLLGFAVGQVHSDCDPTRRDCPPNPAFGTDHLFRFNTTPDLTLWETTAGTVKYDANTGAAFTIRKQGDSPTLRTRFYFFFGRTEIWLQVAPGRGIVSSMMWLSDDLDEVDWEFLGSNATFATTNYFGKGLQDYKNGGSHPMPNTQDGFHNYTTVWTRESIEWFIDGNHVRTLNAKDANNTQNYPQTPMRMSVGIWAGGDPSLPEGTRQWAGGDTDYAAGPYTMHLKSAQITDFSSGKEYKYGDRSGSWQSIKVVDGNSTAFTTLNQQPEKAMGDRWNELSGGAKAGVYAGGAVAGALILGTLAWYYIRQRRLGVAEAEAAAGRELEERRENEQFRTKGIDPDGFSAYGQEHNAHGIYDAKSYRAEPNPFEGPFDEMSRLGSSASHVSGMVGAARSPSGRASPAPSGHGFDFGVPASPGVPMRAQRPGVALPGHHGQYTMRSDSAPPAYSRTVSPAPIQGHGIQRVQSPGMNPQRSFTDNRRDAPQWRGGQ